MVVHSSIIVSTMDAEARLYVITARHSTLISNLHGNHTTGTAETPCGVVIMIRMWLKTKGFDHYVC